jgi:hypothetical protein
MRKALEDAGSAAAQQLEAEPRPSPPSRAPGESERGRHAAAVAGGRRGARPTRGRVRRVSRESRA